MPSPQNREEALFAAALIKSVGERAIFLDGACYGDPALRQRLEALLAAHDATEHLSASEPEAAKEPTNFDPPDAPLEAVGQTLGRYKLLEKVGEGGCGVVYVAEQTKPVRRRVALKVIKLGMDTKSVVARFEAERQALAMMDHPNIAKVLDAGATERGRPYFVMELVRGIRITDYCDQNRLSTNQRLDLFIKVCQAIQHAHQKGIIHRDIKPSNILVTLHDGVPVPKVIDFGIAKATEGRLTDATIYTELHQFIGTPAYMSPEQAEMSGLDIDTRSDIYSLGVLLYELLVGKTPFDAFLLMVSGIDAMRRALREIDPVPPSTRFATLKGQELTEAAKQRSADGSKVVHQLRGDLDWIVLKCLEKDRTRRYETANGLALDIRRHQNNDPVLARPPSTTYRLQKAVSRNKLACLAALAILIALVVGLGSATVMYFRERTALLGEQQQRMQAQTAQKTAEAERARASESQQQARRLLYAEDMNLAQQALKANNLGRARRLLDRHRPQHGEDDIRNWEWRYLWSQTRGDDHEVLSAGNSRLFYPMSFSADGQWLAREQDGVTIVTDLVSRRAVLRRTKALRPAFTHHGLRLAFVDHSSTNEAIVLLDMVSQKETGFGTPLNSISWIGLTPDDKRLLAVSLRPADRSDDGYRYEVSAWDIDAGRQLWKRAMDGRSTANGRPYAISPDGAAFAAVLPHGQVQVLDTQDGAERFNIPATEEIAIAVAFSPDGSTLLTGAGYTDSTIRLWDARNGNARGSLEGHRSWVSDLIFTPDAKTLISSSGDQTIRLWDWATLKPAGVLCGHLDEVDGLALAPNGRTLASRCKDGSIYLWDATKASRRLGYQVLSVPVADGSMVFSPDHQSILGADLDGGVVWWDAFTLRETRHLRGDLTNSAETLISADTRWLTQGDARGRLRVWDAQTALEITNFQAAPGRFHAWSTRDSKFLVTLYGEPANAVIETWRTDTWQKQGSLALPFTGIKWVFPASRSNSFAVTTGQALRLFDAATLDQAPRQIQSQGDVLDLAVSPDGRMLAVAYEDGAVRLWDMETLIPKVTLKGFLLAANSVAFSPDGQRLVASSNGQEAVKLWDTRTWQEVLTLSGEGSQFFGLRFSSDDRCLIAVNTSGLPFVWTAPTPEEVRTTEGEEKKAPPQ